MVEHLPPIKGPSAADKVKDATRKMMESTKTRLTSLKSSVSERFSKTDEEEAGPQGEIPVEYVEDENSETETATNAPTTEDEEEEVVEKDKEVVEENDESDQEEIHELKVLLSDAVDVMQFQSERIKQLQNSIDTLESTADTAIEKELKRPSAERPESLGKDLNMTLNEGLTLMGISLLWLVALIGADQFVTQKGWMLGDVWPADLLTWSMGAGFWSFHILHRLYQAKTLLSMPVGMRIQTSIGVALAAGTALILTAEEFGTVTNIWAYGSVFALLVLLVSGFGGAFSRAFSRRFSKGDRNVSETANESESDASES